MSIQHACHPDNGHDPELWFPLTPSGGRAAERHRRLVTAPAIAICNTCSFKTECAERAEANRAEHGIWGGIDFEGRKYGPFAPAPHCSRGHEYTPENTYIETNGRTRRCRTCMNDYERERRRSGRKEKAA